MDNRSKKFIFIPFCSICQAFQANNIVKYDWKSAIDPIILELLQNNINMIQMPCPEAQFEGYEKGLNREPKGRKHYNSKEFKELCNKLSGEIAEKIKALIKNKYEVIAIMGLEMSPSCAINYQYTNKGMIKKPGFFIESLQEKLKKEEIVVPFIGINRKYINKSLEQLRKEITRTKQI